MQNANNTVFYMLCTVAQLAAEERELFDEDYYNFYTYNDVTVADVVCVKRVNVYCAFYVVGEVQDGLLHAYMDAEGNLYIDGEQYEQYCI